MVVLVALPRRGGRYAYEAGGGEEEESWLVWRGRYSSLPALVAAPPRGLHALILGLLCLVSDGRRRTAGGMVVVIGHVMLKGLKEVKDSLLVEERGRAGQEGLGLGLPRTVVLGEV